jgi:AcrR family transcriptional regulator
MTPSEALARSPSSTRTRDRILEAALALFNSSGIVSVSINSIAAEVGISPGNLYYHFKTKEEIVERLVKRYEGRIEAITSSGSILALDDIWLVVHLELETIQSFRFVYRDIDYLLRDCPRVAQRVQRITAQGVESTRRMCLDLAQAGVIQAEPAEIESLALQMVFTATCWGTFAGLLAGADEAAGSSGRAAYQVLTLLDPYLTADSRLYLAYLRSKYVKTQGRRS